MRLLLSVMWLLLTINFPYSSGLLHCSGAIMWCPSASEVILCRIWVNWIVISHKKIWTACIFNVVRPLVYTSWIWTQNMPVLKCYRCHAGLLWWHNFFSIPIPCVKREKTMKIRGSDTRFSKTRHDQITTPHNRVLSYDNVPWPRDASWCLTAGSDRPWNISGPCKTVSRRLAYMLKLSQKHL